MTIKEFRIRLKDAKRKMKPDAATMRIYGNVVIDERRKLMERGINVEDGTSRQTPLKPATIKRKSGMHSTKRIRKGEFNKGRARASILPQTPLIDTGAMSKPVISKATATEVVITVAGSRGSGSAGSTSISAAHHLGLGRNPKRPHWAIAPQAEDRINKFEEQRIKSILGDLVR